MKKKIVIDLTNLSNKTCGFGQIALNYEKKASFFLQKDYEIIFLVPQEVNVVQHAGITYFRTNKIHKYFSFLLPKADIWYSTNQQFRFLRLTKSTSQILTIHDLNFLHEKKPLKAQRKLKKLQKKVDKASFITTISNYTTEEVKKYIDLKGKEIVTIYNGVERIDQIQGTKPNFIVEKKPFFFALGQVRKKKNFHILIDVMKHFPEYNLYISGEDHYEYAQEIRKRIIEENITNVFMTGSITNEEKVWLYRNCSAFLFPSTLEGFGLPVIEAMQFGKPVFTSTLTSLPEICNGNAFLWENFEPDYMAQLIQKKLTSFYKDEKRISMIKEYAYSFTYEKHIQKYNELYNSLLQKLEKN